MRQPLVNPYASAKRVQAPSAPRVMVVADKALQRLALVEAVNTAGYQVADAMPHERLDLEWVPPDIALWLVQVEDEDKLFSQLPTEASIMLGMEPAPSQAQISDYDRWLKRMVRKLQSELGDPLPLLVEEQDADSPIEATKPDPDWVVLIGASMGGPHAVKRFLDALPPDLPLTVVLAQHIDPTMQEMLPRILVRHNQWPCDVMQDKGRLVAGHVHVAPVRQRVIFDETLGFDVKPDPWPSPYTPSINDTLSQLSRLYGDHLVTLIMSGMGDDGVDSACFASQQGSLIWAQDEASSDCGSQPNAMRETGFVTFSGSPEMLAHKLENLVHGYRAVPANSSRR